jgi:hypothetical protein
MNYQDSIIHLAHNNGKIFSPLNEDEIEDINLPYFEVYKDALGICGYNIRMFNYEKEDNAPRMPYYCHYLLNSIFPNIDKSADITGFYPICLHDSYSYLNDGKIYDNVLTFAKRKQDKYPILIPDPFQIGNYGGRLQYQDQILWEDKKDVIGFYGGTTGNRNPADNLRLNVCDWSLNNRDVSEFHITNIVQMEPNDVLSKYKNFKSMYHNPVSQEEQYKYKYLLSVDGNTSSYDRLCLIMNYKSLLFKYKSDDILWYYPLLMDDTHFVDVNIDNIRAKYMFHKNNPQETKRIITNANKFISTYIKPVNTMMYTTFLFETFAENK